MIDSIIEDGKKLVNIINLSSKSSNHNISVGELSILYNDMDDYIRVRLYVNNDTNEHAFQYSNEFSENNDTSYTYVNKNSDYYEINLQKQENFFFLEEDGIGFDINDIIFTDECYFQNSLIYSDSILRSLFLFKYFYENVNVQFVWISSISMDFIISNYQTIIENIPK